MDDVCTQSNGKQWMQQWKQLRGAGRVAERTHAVEVVLEAPSRPSKAHPAASSAAAAAGRLLR